MLNLRLPNQLFGLKQEWFGEPLKTEHQFSREFRLLHRLWESFAGGLHNRLLHGMESVMPPSTDPIAHSRVGEVNPAPLQKVHLKTVFTLTYGYLPAQNAEQNSP